MKKLGKITLKGASGASYRFSVYPYESEFGPTKGAVYFVTKRKEKAGGRHSHSRIYAGQTADLSASVAGHRKSSSLQSRGPNCVCVHTEGLESTRLEIESDLMSIYRPPGNAPATPYTRAPLGL